MKTIVRLFDDIAIARDAVEDLLTAGFEREKITLLAYDPHGDYGNLLARPEILGDVGDQAAAGASIGALIGGIGGLLLGLGALTIAGIGPIVAAGPIAAALLGAGTGATVGGLVGLLIEANVDQEQAQLYAEGVRRGGSLVVVQAADKEAQRAGQILDRRGPVDPEARSAGWKSRGWRGYRADDAPYAADDVELEQNFYTFEPVYRRHYERYLASRGYPYSRYEPAYYYGYDLVARGGYHDREWREIEPEVRSDWESRDQGSWDEFGSAVRYAWEEAREALSMGDQLYYEDYEDWQPEFRQHYEDNYAASGRSYLGFDHAYRYGYDLAMDERYEDWEWHDLEPEAQREWERRGRDAWEDFRQAVEHAWSHVRAALELDDYDYFDEDFRQDYQANYSSSGYPYEHYRPAYRYGYDLASDERFEGLDWEEIEPEARAGWESPAAEDAWDEIKGAVQRAWRQVRDAFEAEDDYETYGQAFRQHYESNYGASGYAYHDYEPAYRYGYDLASRDYYRNRTWDEIELEARQNWQTQTDSPWEEFKGAVRHAWDQVTGAVTGDEENGERGEENGSGCRQREPEFRRHYQSVYGRSGYPYTRYENAYYYGCELAGDDRYRGRSWEEVESQAQREWLMRGEGLWEEFRDAVRHAWHEATGGSEPRARRDDRYRG